MKRVVRLAIVILVVSLYMRSTSFAVQTPSSAKGNAEQATVPTYQYFQSLCGPTCLAFSATWCGIPLSMEEAVKASKWKLTGTSLLDLKLAAESRGLKCQAIKVSQGNLLTYLARNRSTICCIGQFKPAHFSILLGQSDREARLVDPGLKLASVLVKLGGPELELAQSVPVLLISAQSMPAVDVEGSSHWRYVPAFTLLCLGGCCGLWMIRRRVVEKAVLAT